VAARAPAPAAPDPNRIAILPFRVSGADPSLAYLQDGMVDLLAAEFNGEGVPAAVEAGSAIRAWTRAGGSAAADQATALRVARQLGAGQVMLGAVVGTPQRLSLTASILRVPGGEVRVRQVRVEGSADSLAVLISRLTARLTGQTQAWRTTDNAPGTTSSDALRAFMAGRAAYRRGEYAQAIGYLSGALGADSSFVLAAHSLVLASDWGSTVPQLDVVRRVAWEGRHRLGPEDRALLAVSLGPRFPHQPSAAERLAAAQRAVTEAPLAPEAHFQLGDVYFHWGEELGYAEAVAVSTAAFERSLALDTTASALGHLVENALRVGSFEEARRYATLLRSFAPESDLLGLRLWLTAVATGDSAAAHAAWRHPRYAGDRDDNLYAAGLIQRLGLPAALAREAIARARSLAVAAEQADAAEQSEAVRLFNIGQRAAARARFGTLPDPDGWVLYYALELSDSADVELRAREVWRRLDALPAESTETERRAFQACPAGLYRAQQGDTAAARRAVALLRRVERPLWSACADLIEGVASAVAGGPLEPLRRADSTVREVPPATAGTWLSMFLARAYAARGRYREAAAAARRRNFQPTIPPYLLAPSYRDEGRYAVLAGDTMAAIRAFRRYLTLRAEPDAELRPERDSVLAELSRLEGRE
jgi:tetratricopeptide (TPR) repeat protein/TolB-like protein